MDDRHTVIEGTSTTSSQRLVMSQGPHRSQVFMLDREGMTLGRHSSNNIVVEHPVVSRHHARITRHDQTMMIEDLGSANGTFVNGVRLTAPHVLVDGDVISLGQEGVVTFTYHRAPSAQYQPPAAEQQLPPAQQQPPPVPAARRRGGSWLVWLVIGLVLIFLLGALLAAGVLGFDMLGLMSAP